MRQLLEKLRACALCHFSDLQYLTSALSSDYTLSAVLFLNGKYRYDTQVFKSESHRHDLLGSVTYISMRRLLEGLCACALCYLFDLQNLASILSCDHTLNAERYKIISDLPEGPPLPSPRSPKAPLHSVSGKNK